MNDFEIKDLSGNSASPFIKSYRDSLKRQYDFGVSSLNTAQKNKEASIMSNANKSGVMFSNFPERAKMQSLSADYMPALTKLHTGYQTGLQSLRNNAVNTYNNILKMQEETAAMNDLNKNNDTPKTPDIPKLPNGWTTKDGNLLNQDGVVVGKEGEHVYEEYDPRTPFGKPKNWDTMSAEERAANLKERQSLWIKANLAGQIHGFPYWDAPYPTE